MIDLTEKFDDILEVFDFQKVLKVMQVLDWKWATVSGYHIPDVDEMKEMCCMLFDHAIEQRSEGKEVAENSGGFEVTIYSNNTFELKFIATVCEYDSEMDLIY